MVAHSTHLTITFRKWSLDQLKDPNVCVKIRDEGFETRKLDKVSTEKLRCCCNLVLICEKNIFEELKVFRHNNADMLPICEISFKSPNQQIETIVVGKLKAYQERCEGFIVNELRDGFLKVHKCYS